MKSKLLKKLFICGLITAVMCTGISLMSACNTDSSSEADTQVESSSQSVVSENLTNDSDGLEYTLSDDGTYYTVSGYSGSATSVTIPSTYNGIAVTEINDGRLGHGAFEWSSKLENIVIPDSITYIEPYAFQYCSSLTSITIPDSVETIGGSAFYQCTALTNITIPNSVTYIGSEAFGYCTSLTSITIPDSVTYLGSQAFYYCTSLESVNLGNGLSSLYFATFKGCTLISTITIPASITYMQGGTTYGGPFEKCNLKNVTFENTEGWYVTAESGKRIDFTSEQIKDSATAAKYLYTYSSYYWYNN